MKDDLQDQINAQITAASKKQPEALSENDNEEIVLKNTKSPRPAKISPQRTILDEEEEISTGGTFDLSSIELPQKAVPKIESSEIKSIADLLQIEADTAKNPPKKQSNTYESQALNTASSFYKTAIQQKTVFFPSSVKPLHKTLSKDAPLDKNIAEITTNKTETNTSALNTEIASPADVSKVAQGASSVSAKTETSETKPVSQFSNIGGNLKKIELANTQESPILRKLRTLKGDVAEAMQSGKANIVSIAAAEAESRAKQAKELEAKMITKPKPVSETKPRSHLLTNFLAIFLSIALIGGGSFAVYYLNKKQKEPVTIVNDLNLPGPLIPVQFAVPIYIDEKNPSYLRANFEAERKRNNGKVNEMGEVLFLTTNTGNADKERAITTEEFFTALQMKPPISLTRTLHPHFMAGFHRFGEVESFLIFNTDTYDVARAGMLEWEKTMEEEVGKFMRTPSDFDYPSDVNSTINPRVFVDKVYKNIDTRTLFNESEKPLLMYAFINRSYLIIATNEETLSEVVAGLSARKIVK